jgi:hypothetical protein
MFAAHWLVGLLGFGWRAQLLAISFRDDLVFAAFLLSIGFAVIIGCVAIGIVLWQRAHGETLSELGWRRPTTRTALVLGVVFGVAWAALSYARGGNPTMWTWERVPMALIGMFLAFGEELAVQPPDRSDPLYQSTSLGAYRDQSRRPPGRMRPYANGLVLRSRGEIAAPVARLERDVEKVNA